MGGQTTSTRELVRLVQAAERVGADYVQVSPPFYFAHTEGDFLEYVLAGRGRRRRRPHRLQHVLDEHRRLERAGRAARRLPNVVGLKWSTPDAAMMTFEDVVSRFSTRFAIIDNQMPLRDQPHAGRPGDRDPRRQLLAAVRRRLWEMLEAGAYAEAQREMVRVCMPFMLLWGEMEAYTGGDGYLDKLCMELVGLPRAAAARPRETCATEFRDKARQMLLACGVPGVAGA